MVFQCYWRRLVLCLIRYQLECQPDLAESSRRIASGTDNVWSNQAPGLKIRAGYAEYFERRRDCANPAGPMSHQGANRRLEAPAKL